MRREVITLIQIHHTNIVPFLGIVADDHHPLALISPYYERGHASRYLKKLESAQRSEAALRIVSCHDMKLIPRSLISDERTEYFRCIWTLLSAFADSSNCPWRPACRQCLKYLTVPLPMHLSSVLSQQNVVIDDAGNALLIDFGLARINHEVTRSKTGLAPAGKYRYMAPELYASIIADSKFRTSSSSDSYSLGMTILALITLQHPFPECGTEEAAAQRALSGTRPTRPDHVDGWQPNVIDSLWTVIMKMWEKDVKSRPGVDAAKNDLQDILSLVVTI